MIKVKQLKNLTSKEVGRVSKLTNYAEDGGASYMLRSQIEPRMAIPTIYAILCYEDEKVIGWATLEKKSSLRSCRRGRQSTFYSVFVDPKYRRRGIGSKLIKKAKAVAKDKFPSASREPMAWPFDDKGYAFYRKNFKKIAT